MESIASKERKRDRIRKFLGKGIGTPDDQCASEDAIALRPKASSDDPHKLVAVDTATVVSEPPKVVTDDLWAEAYERCKVRESDLVDRYEQHMKAYTSSAGRATNDRFDPEEIAGLVKARRGDLDAQRLTLRLHGRPIAIREQGEKIVKFILWFNSTISSALTSQPYASLAWSGVSIILPLLLNPSKQSQKMMDGLQTISELMTRCHLREKLSPQDACFELRDAYVELYSIIFEYQARCVCHLSLRSAQRALKDTVEVNDWTGMLEKIDNADKHCVSLLAIFDKSTEHTVQAWHAQELVHQTEVLQNFQRKFSESREYDLEAGLLTSLASDYEGDKALIPRRVDGTCEWFFSNERFHRWRDNDSSSILWISAGPGCGKSVLAKTLIDECLLSSASALHTTTCYFFFKDGEEQRTKASNALSAMLHQLLNENPQLISNALPSSKSFGDNLSNTFSELWKVLTKTAEDENAGRIICVLDALDECEKNSMKMVIDKIIGYYGDRSQRSPSAVLKFLVTSRPYSRIRSAFEHLRGVDGYVRVDGDKRSPDISKDINLVIDYKVPRMTQDFAAQDRERISSRLKKGKHRTYLWLYLILNIIDREQGKYSKASQIETLLSNLPVDVSGAYERMLLQGNDIEKAQALLQIVIAAKRRLTLAEANVALTMATHRKKPRSLDELDLWPEESFKSTVQDMCGLFVSIHHGKLSLIHQTARRFLLQTVTKSSDKHSKDVKWSSCFVIERAHEVLCSICINYLILNYFTKQTARSKLREDYATASSEAPAFFDYAARKWVVHYGQALQQKAGPLQTRAIALCELDYTRPAHWFPIYASKELSFLESSLSEVEYASNNEHWSAVGIASVLGLADIVHCLLARATDVDHRAGHFETATRAAIVMEHTEILRLLCPFNTSARFQLDPRSGVNALQALTPTISLSTETVSQESAMAKISDDLSYAISVHSGPETHRILLEHGADPNFQDEKGETLLLKAFDIEDFANSWQDLTERVRHLLEFGADPDRQSKAGIPPLQEALKKGCPPAVVCLLLQAGANVNVASPNGETAISLAKNNNKRLTHFLTQDEAAEIVQLLREAGAEEDIEEVFDEGEAYDMKRLLMKKRAPWIGSRIDPEHK